QSGLQPGGDDGYFQIWPERGGESGETARLKNVIGILPGTRPEYDGQSVVIAAHYDHLGRGWPEPREEKYRGQIHPGADDNASGVAVLLELARTLGRSLKPERSILFIAFSGEEAGRKGSLHYLANSGRYPNDKCTAMINLDTVGRLGNKKLLVLGAESASEWVHIIRGTGFVTGVEMEVVRQPLDASDHVSFHEAGIPAIQIFAGPNMDYHRPGDTADKIDADGLVKVATVSREALEYLAQREQPLTTTLTKGAPAAATAKTSRRVRLGTIPDFAYSGNGVRLSGVAPGSPAATSRLKEGDIIVRINDEECTDIKALSNLLKQLNPGDRIAITYLRDGKERVVETVVSGR
ncbi:MAG TPA: M20/M25/M40 family metallo-hydrolase, partial [Gammaproteobacteria bacterium]|nr:M20/M25/M40 family metallo-hydrolase [Gammaproteobacteria bacterium]